MLSLIQNSNKWSFGIGDPTFVGWLIFAAYITAAILCGRCAYFSRKNRQSKHWKFWLTITILLALLAINKQLDFQTLLTDIARNMARKQGWYDQRQGFQIFVISAIAAVGTAMIILSAGILRNNKPLSLTFIGLILLLTFIVIRAASLHSVDQIIAMEVVGIKLRYLLELAAITCIAISAAISAKSY